MNINISDLNKRITFKSHTTIENALGDNVAQWLDFKTVWASVSNLSGREYWSAVQIQAEKTIKFTVRYCKDFDEAMKIAYGKKTINEFDDEGMLISTKEIDVLYDIKFIDDSKYPNKTFMEILAMGAI